MANLLGSRQVLFLSLLVLVTTLDQLSKSFFVSICNSGVALGFLNSQGFINTVISFLVVLVLLYFLRKQKEETRFFALSLIIAGGASNLFDRFFLGCIQDFIQIGNLPTFNLADGVVSVGVLILGFRILTTRPKV